MLLNEQITQLRKQKKLSQEELAAALQVSRQAVSKWENGVSNPDTENLIRLAEIFEVDVNVLIGCEGNQKSTQEEKVPEGKIPDQRRLVWLLSVLLAVAVCAAVLFGTLWAKERYASKDIPEFVKNESGWDSVKLYNYVDLEKIEIPLTTEEQKLLADTIWCYHYTEKNKKDEQGLYGGLCAELILQKNGVTYSWSFTPMSISISVLLADGYYIKNTYEPDNTIVGYLLTYINKE